MEKTAEEYAPNASVGEVNKQKTTTPLTKQPAQSRYWGMRLALLMARVIAYLPWRVQLVLGGLLGSLCHAVLKRRREVCATNIAHCFPALSAMEQRQLVKDCFRSTGMAIMEALRSWFRDPASLHRQTRVEGLEHLQAAQAQGKGVILLGAHYTTLDLAGSLTTMYFRADVMQRGHSHPVFDAFMTGSRARLYEKVIDKHDVRSLLRSLKANHIVWYATDQDAGRNNTVFAPFFGVPAATLVSTMRLAKRSGAAVVPFSHFRLPGFAGYVLRFEPALENFPSGDDLADATRLNQIIERNVREYPEQYLWLHRRFKTPPEVAGVNIYGQRRELSDE